MDELIAKLGVVSGIGNNVLESLLDLKLGATGINKFNIYRQITAIFFLPLKLN